MHVFQLLCTICLHKNLIAIYLHYGVFLCILSRKMLFLYIFIANS